MQPIKKWQCWLMGLLLLILAGQPVLSAAPAATAGIRSVRFSTDADRFRIVLEMTSIPAYTVSAVDSPLQLELELPDTVNRSGPNQMNFNDPFVEKMVFTDLGGGRFKGVISLKLPVLTKVSVLQDPARLVLDLLKNYDSRKEYIIEPGVIYREFIRGRSEGPVRIHALEVDLRAGYELKPVLSNDVVAGTETLSAIAERTDNVALINGPFYMRNGEILGLMKIDRTVVSSPDIPRTCIGMMPDGRLIFDTPDFSAHVELPDNSRIPIDGVNRSRGDSELILYNGYHAFWTLTGKGGREYVVRGGRIVEIREANSIIPDGAVVLSATGRPALMLSGLKVGSRVNIVQTIGPDWDQAVHAVGGGPRLLKNGELFVSTLGEEFGSDVAGGRAPRTAVGATRDGKALLVVVDGRRRTSVGMTLLELAQFLLDQGAVEALNLDGGGSSQMVIGNRTVNEPSDGKERRISAGIAVLRTNNR